MSINSRTKGATLERDRVKFWKSIGYPDAATSRAESKNADNLGIDLCNIPVIEQCKNGYASGINYDALLLDIRTRIKKTKYNSYLLVIIHKKNRNSFRAIMSRSEFNKLIKHFKYPEFYDFVNSSNICFDKTTVSMDISNYNYLVSNIYGLHNKQTP